MSAPAFSTRRTQRPLCAAPLLDSAILEEGCKLASLEPEEKLFYEWLDKQEETP